MKSWMRSLCFYVFWGAIGLGISWLIPGIGQSLQYWIGVAGSIFLALIVLTLIAGIGYVAWEWIANNWRGGDGEKVHHSHDDPPWHRPRYVSECGTPEDRANFHALRKRLKPLSNPIAVETLRKVQRKDAPLNDYFTPCAFVDRLTGQKWVEIGYEVGFNQWCELVPIGIEENEGDAKNKTDS